MWEIEAVLFFSVCDMRPQSTINTAFACCTLDLSRIIFVPLIYTFIMTEGRKTCAIDKKVRDI